LMEPRPLKGKMDEKPDMTFDVWWPALERDA
jgi:hypothetical protein